MAELFRAVHLPSGHRVVIKRLLPELEARPDIVDLFLNEADIGRLLQHPNVVRVLDAGEYGGRYWLAMEYIDGSDVARLLRHARVSDTQVPVAITMRIGVDAARGLYAAHTLTSPQGNAFGLVHRDVSPDNLFVTRDGHTKVADFGIAKLAAIEGVTSTGLLKGKVSYMSPEHVKGVPLDGRADLFSLALVLFELLAAHRPFDPQPGETEIDTLMRIRRGRVPRLERYTDDVPRPIAKVIGRALRKSRWLRYRDCGAFADELESSAHQAGVLASPDDVAQFALRLAATTPA